MKATIQSIKGTDTFSLGDCLSRGFSQVIESCQLPFRDQSDTINVDLAEMSGANYSYFHER